jgi:hypothetical protein
MTGRPWRSPQDGVVPDAAPPGPPGRVDRRATTADQRRECTPETRHSPAPTVG